MQHLVTLVVFERYTTHLPKPYTHKTMAIHIRYLQIAETNIKMITYFLLFLTFIMRNCLQAVIDIGYHRGYCGNPIFT